MPNLNEGYVNLFNNQISKNTNDIKELRNEIDTIKELYETDNLEKKNDDN